MSVSGTGSASSLMSWLITHNNDLNTSLDDAMHQGDLNVGVQKELKDIENHIKSCNTYGYGNVAADMDAFIQKHQNDPDCAAIVSQLTGLRDNFSATQTAWQNNEDANKTGASSADVVVQTRKNLFDGAVSKADDIEAILDASKKMDELQMTRINDLTSQRSQAFQLASNMMASGNQVLSGMINNIKG